jgi:hypothetical protein
MFLFLFWCALALSNCKRFQISLIRLQTKLGFFSGPLLYFLALVCEWLNKTLNQKCVHVLPNQTVYDIDNVALVIYTVFFSSTGNYCCSYSFAFSKEHSKLVFLNTSYPPLPCSAIVTLPRTRFPVWSYNFSCHELILVPIIFQVGVWWIHLKF